MRVVQDGLQRHVGLGADLVAADYLQALGKSLVDLDVLLDLAHIFLLLLHLRQPLLKLRLELGVDFGQSKVDDHAAFGVGVVEEVAGLDVSVVDAEVLEVFESDEEFVDVVLDLLDGEGVEEGLLRAGVR